MLFRYKSNYLNLINESFDTKYEYSQVLFKYSFKTWQNDNVVGVGKLFQRRVKKVIYKIVLRRLSYLISVVLLLLTLWLVTLKSETEV